MDGGSLEWSTLWAAAASESASLRLSSPPPADQLDVVFPSGANVLPNDTLTNGMVSKLRAIGQRRIHYRHLHVLSDTSLSISIGSYVN